MNRQTPEYADEYILTLTHAVERDIDLLLVEELQCDADFVEWLASFLPARIPRGKVVITHSKRRTFERREIDIEVRILAPEDDRLNAIILIENKIDEKEQPGQGLSYREEKTFLLNCGTAQSVSTVLLCPKSYGLAWPEFVAQFDAVISYEAIYGFFLERVATCTGELAARMNYRGRLISQAITKQRRGYRPIPISKVGTFNDQYVAQLAELTSDIVPGNGLRLGGDKPSDSVSMIFDCKKSFSGLAQQIVPSRFAHELGRGKVHRANYVNVQFRGFDRGFDKLGQWQKDEFGRHGLTVKIKEDRRSGKKILKLMVPTPAVDNQAPFADVKAKVREGIEAAIKLRQWCFEQQDLLVQISRLSEA